MCWVFTYHLDLKWLCCGYRWKTLLFAVGPHPSSNEHLMITHILQSTEFFSGHFSVFVTQYYEIILENVTKIIRIKLISNSCKVVPLSFLNRTSSNVSGVFVMVYMNETRKKRQTSAMVSVYEIKKRDFWFVNLTTSLAALDSSFWCACTFVLNCCITTRALGKIKSCEEKWRNFKYWYGLISELSFRSYFRKTRVNASFGIFLAFLSYHGLFYYLALFFYYFLLLLIHQ